MNAYDEETLIGEQRGGRPTRGDDESSGRWLMSRGIGLLITLIAIAGLVLGAIAVSRGNDDDDDIGPGEINCPMDKPDSYQLLQSPEVLKLNWPSFGRDPSGSRYQPHFESFDANDDSDFENVLTYQTDSTSGVSADITQATDGDLVAVTWGNEDGSGTISDAAVLRIDGGNGNTVWKTLMSQIAVDEHTASRTAPSFFTDSTGVDGVFLCDLGTPNFTCSNTNNTFNDASCGAYCYALRYSDGGLMWRTRVSSQPEALVTASPNIVGQFAYFGLSSREAALLESDAFTNPSFVGEAFVINLNNGDLIITQSTLFGNDVANLTGAASWSFVSYDIDTDTAVYPTGNLYTISENVTGCLQTTGETAWSCLPDRAWPDSLIAVRGARLWGHNEPRDFEEKWVFSAQGVDAWNLACLSDPEGANCPDVEGPDYDFGAGSIITTNGCGEKVVISFQKSGVLWAFYLNTGEEKWRTYVGPGSTLNNNWGMAYDGYKVYMTVGNSEGKRYRTLDGTVRCDGFVAAVWVDSGDIEWITPLPNSRASTACPAAEVDQALTRYFSNDVLLFADRGPTQNLAGAVSDDPNPEPDATRDTSDFSIATGPVTVANGVAYVGSWNGYMYAFDTSDGDIKRALSRCDTGSIYGGASAGKFVIDGQYYEQLAWGCGYTNNANTLGDSEIKIIRNPV